MVICYAEIQYITTAGEREYFITPRYGPDSTREFVSYNSLRRWESKVIHTYH